VPECPGTAAAEAPPEPSASRLTVPEASAGTALTEPLHLVHDWITAKRETTVLVVSVSPLRLLLLAIALTGALALTAPAAATAAKPCWIQIFDDWQEDEVIDGRYSQKCYRQAEANIPQDLRDYSVLPDEITRARQRDLRASAREQANEETRTLANSGPVDARNDNDNDGGGTPADGGGPIGDLLEAAGPSSADSAPIPLLVLAGLALLLVAAGAAGLLSRKLSARRARATPPITPDG
jgi:hypothetical protein